MKRSAIRDIGSNMWILKFHLWHRCCKDNTVQSATNEIVTKDRKTILQHKEKTDKSRDPLEQKNGLLFLGSTNGCLLTPKELKGYGCESKIRQPVAKWWFQNLFSRQMPFVQAQH